MKPTAIILAAGESRRMGVPKALLEATPGTTFLAQLIATLAEAGASPLVVLGAHVDLIRAAHPRISFVLNQGWARGQLSSVHVGLRAALAQGATQILVHPIDAPMISVATARCVLHALAQSQVVIPTFEGAPGHPLGLEATAARGVLSSPATTLAEAVAAMSPTQVPVDDRAILDNFNSPDAYQLRFGHAPGGCG